MEPFKSGDEGTGDWENGYEASSRAWGNTGSSTDILPDGGENDYLSGYCVSPPSTLRKRQINSTPEWSKRQKMDGGHTRVTYPAAALSASQQPQHSFQTDNTFFPKELYAPARTAFSQGQVTSSSENKTLVRPPPPISQLYPPSEASTSSTLDGHKSGNATPSTTAFTNLSQDNEPYWSPQEQDNPITVLGSSRHVTTIGNIQHWVQDNAQHNWQPKDEETTSSFGCNDNLIPASGIDHISAFQRHLYSQTPEYKNSQRVAQTPCRSKKEPSPMDTKDDGYSVALSDEQDMAQLVDSFSTNAPQIPPSSVMRDMDMDSDMDIFDPTLQRSSPRKSSVPNIQDEDLLSSDVDWDTVFESVPNFSNSMALPNYILDSTPKVGDKDTTGDVQTGLYSNKTNPSMIKNIHPMAQGTHPKLSFPSSAMDRSPATSPSSSSKMATFFRVSELLTEGKRRFNGKHQATFELYAWVTHSWRERDSKVQYFHFSDLFKEQRIDLRGTLNGWNAGGDLDQQSSKFLFPDENGRYPQLCRCVCKLKQDMKVGMGWELVIVWIRPATWEEITEKGGFLSVTGTGNK